MINYEYIANGKLIRHYSDKNMIIRQIETGAEYVEAVDTIPCKYTYEETDNLIETEDNMSPEDKQEE